MNDMRGPKNLVVSKNTCGKCKHEFKSDPSQAMKKCISEYQTAYKVWPWQPMRQKHMPTYKRSKLPKDTVPSQMERKSVYGVDFGTIGLKKKMRKVGAGKVRKPDTAFPVIPDSKDAYECECKAKKVIPPEQFNPVSLEPIGNQQPFKAGTEYNDTYKQYDEKEVKDCRPMAAKIKDNFGIITNTKPKSTDQNQDQVQPCCPTENTQSSYKPLQSNTEYSDYYTNKTKVGHREKTAAGKPGFLAMGQIRSEYAPLSTAQAAYTKPVGFVPMKPCQPPINKNFFDPGPFEGSTTFGDAYRAWPIKRRNLPSWAKRQEYKQPVGGMALNTIYMGDYRDPEVSCKTLPIRPDLHGEPVIQRSQPPRVQGLSTYNRDFKEWENVEPAKSYQTHEIYTPPTVKMICETNNRSDFTGHQDAKKMLPCRHSSQHRELSNNQYTEFVTTYKETFVPPYNRPISNQTTPPAHPPSKSVRINSAPNFATCPPGFNALPMIQANSPIPGPLPEVTLSVNAHPRSQ